MSADNSIVQATGIATANALATALDGLTIQMDASVEQLNREQEDDCVSGATISVLSSLLHLLYCNRNAATACYEQLLAEQKQAAQSDKTSPV